MPIGLDLEEVGFGFNADVIAGLLREKYGFDGVVCTDWGLLNDSDIGGRVMVARAWGVEHLSVAERAKKALDAGVDQFGGEACPELIVELVRSGQIAESRIDESVRRLLRDKFRLGLFDNPYVDLDAAKQLVGNESFRAAGAEAQRRAIVLLKNNGVLPARGTPKLYVENIAPEVAALYGQVVQSVEDADLAILRLAAPFVHRDGNFLERLFHAGDLAFKPDERRRILSILAKVPSIVDIYLDRPAVIPEIAAEAAALLANFDASDAAVLDVIFGRYAPSGKLPFELPSSVEAVQQQKSDLPYDSENPLFAFGHGLTYKVV
jgi:beta-glucosidase